MTHKEIAKLFLELAGSGKVEEAFSKFVASDFIHHNQYFKGDRAALEQAMSDAHEKSPNKAIVIKYCYKDGDTIITHSLVEKEEMNIAVVHIFRFVEDKIVELWDLGQVIEKHSPNENGLF
ncbi:nuclear transport factor 2 family protein [Portibacter lacus]|nr:nuclear transport factor 2 family protein [Portibacter lacus]